MKSKLLGRTFLVFFTIALSGCANTANNLQRATARSVGDVAADQVQVTDVRRMPDTVTWNATTPDGSYRCSGNADAREVSCTPRL